MPSWLIMSLLYIIIICVFFVKILYANKKDKYFNKLKSIIIEDFEQKYHLFMIDNEEIIVINKLTDIDMLFRYTYNINDIPYMYRDSNKIESVLVWFKHELTNRGYVIEYIFFHDFNITIKI